MFFLAASAPRYVAPVAMLTFSLTMVSSATVYSNQVSQQKDLILLLTDFP